MPPRILPDRPLTDAEKQARKRAANKLYLRSLEQAVSDATWMSPGKWCAAHGATISQAVRQVERAKAD